jgi:hypothetical protein
VPLVSRRQPVAQSAPPLIKAPGVGEVAVLEPRLEPRPQDNPEPTYRP